MQQKQVNQPDNQEKNAKPVNKQVEENVQNAVGKAEAEVTRSSVPWYLSSKRARILLLIYAVQLILFSLLAWWVHVNPVLPIDVTITREFQENQTPWIRFTMVAVSFIGYAYIFTPLVLLTALLFWVVRLRLEALFIVGVSLTSTLLNGLIKLIVARPRPTSKLVEIITAAGGQSFPSGHVMAYVAFWGLLFSFGIILFKRDRWWQYALLIIPALFVILVGPSRIYVGDHWASDVLGGYLFGGVWLGLSLGLYLRLKNKGVLARKKTAVV